MMNPDPIISLAIIFAYDSVNNENGFDVSETLPLSTLNGRGRNTDVAEAVLLPQRDAILLQTFRQLFYSLIRSRHEWKCDIRETEFFIRDIWPAHQTFFLTHQRNTSKLITVNIWLQNYNFVCIYMGVKLGLPHWEKNIEWECYWNNFMYIYMYMGVKLGLSHWEKNIEWGCLWMKSWGRDMVMRWRKVTGEWTAFQKQRLNNLYCCQNILRLNG